MFTFLYQTDELSPYYNENYLTLAVFFRNASCEQFHTGGCRKFTTIPTVATDSPCQKREKKSDFWKICESSPLSGKSMLWNFGMLQSRPPKFGVSQARRGIRREIS